jgi:crossover junction endodeoxyribonuclease RusA
VLLSKEGRGYQEAVARTVRARWPGLSSPIKARLKVEILLNAPTRQARDVDNYAKSILDGLAHAGVFANDSQIDDLRLIRSNAIGKPGTVDVYMYIVHSGTAIVDARSTTEPTKEND